MSEKITLVGGGLAGSLMSIYLAKKGYECFTPIHDYSKVDLIAMNSSSQTFKIQVKYRTTFRNKIEVGDLVQGLPKIIQEDNMAGSGGALGSGESFGHGGDFGNSDFYATAKFVHLLPNGQMPQTNSVLGSNSAHI